MPATPPQSPNRRDTQQKLVSPGTIFGVAQKFTSKLSAIVLRKKTGATVDKLPAMVREAAETLAVDHAPASERFIFDVANYDGDTPLTVGLIFASYDDARTAIIRHESKRGYTMRAYPSKAPVTGSLKAPVTDSLKAPVTDPPKALVKDKRAIGANGDKRIWACNCNPDLCPQRYVVRKTESAEWKLLETLTTHGNCSSGTVKPVVKVLASELPIIIAARSGDSAQVLNKIGKDASRSTVSRVKKRALLVASAVATDDVVHLPEMAKTMVAANKGGVVVLSTVGCKAEAGDEYAHEGVERVRVFRYDDEASAATTVDTHNEETPFGRQSLKRVAVIMPHATRIYEGAERVLYADACHLGGMLERRMCKLQFVAKINGSIIVLAWGLCEAENLNSWGYMVGTFAAPRCLLLTRRQSLFLSTPKSCWEKTGSSAPTASRGCPKCGGAFPRSTTWRRACRARGICSRTLARRSRG